LEESSTHGPTLPVDVDALELVDVLDIVVDVLALLLLVVPAPPAPSTRSFPHPVAASAPAASIPTANHGMDRCMRLLLLLGFYEVTTD
jgi:hypothetical protein